MRSRVIDANVEVHTRMAATYSAAEPHYRPENQAKVRAVLEELRGRVSGGRLLDLGCGTGFIIDLARGIFEDIHGIDVTAAMLELVDRRGGVQLHRALAEALPFADGTFDVVSAYSFIHHTEDYWKVIAEAGRVLKPRGILYIDLEPNRGFWTQMTALPPGDAPELSSIVRRARDSVTEVDAKVEREYGIPRETFCTAEWSKSKLGGIDGAEICRRASALGFSGCTVSPIWFLGQAEIMHGQSFEQADRIDAYLRTISPVADHLFKYLRLVLVK
jgi:SAM-dependent methyltransferase